MPNEWDVARLGDVCQINPEKRDASWPHLLINYIDIASVGSGTLNERATRTEVTEAPSRAQRIVRPGDTIISTVRPNRRSFLYLSDPDPTTVVSTGFAVLRAGESLDPRYLYYLVTNQAFTDYLVTHEEGSAYPAVNPLVFADAEVPIPDLSEQRAIGHILGTLDDKIELNRQMNETLESMARTLFKSWFVDFDPVHAKSEGRSSRLSAAVDTLFPSSFQESELGQVPDGWSSATLAQLALLNSETWSRATYPEAVNYVDLSNAKWGHLESIAPYEKADAPSRAQRVLRCGDSIVGMVRPGNGSYALVAEDGLTGSTGFAVLRPRKKTSRDFVYLAATNPENIDRLAHLADGGAYPAVLPNTVIATHIVCPSDAVMSSFSHLVAPMLDRAAACDRESRTLASIRDTLLPKLLSGELRVRDGEIDVSKRNVEEGE